MRVIAFENDQEIPLPDDSIELIINRHESYHVPELNRILKNGGVFLTQQVGALDCIQLNEFLGAQVGTDANKWALKNEIQQLEQSDLQILRAEEELLDSTFDDIGVVVFFLKIIEWQIPDFSVQKYHDQLLEMHKYILANGPFKAKAHRFLIEAQKP